MARVRLTLAINDYDHVRDLVEGDVPLDGLELTWLRLPVEETFFRFIRYRAKQYHIDPERIGVTGLSAGGHLSLMQGVAADKGNPKSPDPVDREACKAWRARCRPSRP